MKHNLYYLICDISLQEASIRAGQDMEYLWQISLQVPLSWGREDNNGLLHLYTPLYITLLNSSKPFIPPSDLSLLFCSISLFSTSGWSIFTKHTICTTVIHILHNLSSSILLTGSYYINVVFFTHSIAPQFTQSVRSVISDFSCLAQFLWVSSKADLINCTSTAHHLNCCLTPVPFLLVILKTRQTWVLFHLFLSTLNYSHEGMGSWLGVGLKYECFHS